MQIFSHLDVFEISRCLTINVNFLCRILYPPPSALPPPLSHPVPSFLFPLSLSSSLASLLVSSSLPGLKSVFAAWPSFSPSPASCPGREVRCRGWHLATGAWQWVMGKARVLCSHCSVTSCAAGLTQAHDLLWPSLPSAAKLH